MKHLSTYLLHTAWTKDESKLLDDMITFVEDYSGQNFLFDVAQYLYLLLQIDYILIALQVNSENKSVVFLERGKPVPNIVYKLEGTACANVVGNDLCYFPSGVQNNFPEDQKLKQLKIESYFGVPVFDNQDNSIGLVALLHSSIIERGGFVESLLNSILPHIERELIFFQLTNNIH